MIRNARNGQSCHNETNVNSNVIRLPVLKRPVTRGECADVPRPCPFATCRFHLERDDAIGERRYRGIHHAEAMQRRREDGVTESCALDYADHLADTRSTASEEDVARLLGITKQGVQKIERKAMKKLALRARRLR